MSDTVTVTDRPSSNRYEVHEGGVLAGYTLYHRAPGLLTVRQTVMKPGFEHRGLAHRLVEQLLVDAAASGTAVDPVCSFTRVYLKDHPEHLSSVPEEIRVQRELVSDAPEA
jgi:predicted GNAT family acetyltransferase